jgi:type II secretory ATPase GspE/PulE/Tfp pilus assembly ATPase PilB-like protein
MEKLTSHETTCDAIRTLEALVQKAGRAGASDIHLQTVSEGANVLFRLDGVMVDVERFAPELAARVFGRIKFLANLKTYQEALPQDGRIDKTLAGAASDLRVATYPTVTGEKIVLRLFQPATVSTLGQLQFPESIEAELDRFLSQSSGLLLLTGPSGSGKTTTIYACLRELTAGGGRHVITVEDPAEQVIPGIMQTEVNEARGLDFAKAARHLLRQDPQVLVIGEIRDEETAGICVRAALTGHLVISTLHAGSCQKVFQRLLSLCADASAIASAVELVLNQRLIRLLCRACKGSGCTECLGSGYRGRKPIAEIFRVQEQVRPQIAARSLNDIIASPTLAEQASALVASGETDQKEVTRILGFAPNL